MIPAREIVNMENINKYKSYVTSIIPFLKKLLKALETEKRNRISKWTAYCTIL